MNGRDTLHCLGLRWWKWTWKYFTRQNHYWHPFHCTNGSSNLLQTSPVWDYCTVKLASWLCRLAANVSSAITSTCLKRGDAKRDELFFFSSECKFKHSRNHWTHFHWEYFAYNAHMSWNRNHHTMHARLIHWSREHHGCINVLKVGQMGCHKTNQLAIWENKNQYFGTMQNVNVSSYGSTLCP